MRRWVAERLRADSERSLVVILDAEDVLTEQDLSELAAMYELLHCQNWLELRRHYEQRGRNRALDDRPLGLVVKSEEFGSPEDLPFDIESVARVVALHVPAPPECRELVSELPSDLQDRAVEILKRRPAQPLQALERGLWGVELPASPESRELEAVIRLVTDQAVPRALWGLLRPSIVGPLARALFEEPPDINTVQSAWADWTEKGSQSRWSGLFEAVGVRLAPLFHAGVVNASRRMASLPSWATFGIEEAPARERLESLLGLRPDPWPPRDAFGWIRAAEWWGEVRAAAALAEGASERGLVQRAWASWSELDTAFRPWLVANLADRMLASHARWPATVDKIAPFLARRVREGAAEKILLVVMDGMGFCQWSILRRSSRLRAIEPGACFAMVPTLTSVSRQAIFSGTRPSAFAKTIRSTAAEPKRWAGFWDELSRSVGPARYIKVVGHFPEDLPDLGTGTVVGMVVEAVDKSLHGAEILGDAQVASTVQLWGRKGFLRGLVERAVGAGFEVWVTSDHGNLESLPSGRIMEGLAVESAGVRVRWYQTAALREGAKPDGEAWDPPGLPGESIYPLFAPGRTGYFSGRPGATRVTHGGISLDEVIVPLSRVVP